MLTPTTKTTELIIGLNRLLDVLAQRKDSGEVYGSILIDGRPQGISFQRLTGYCEQMDVHERTATVREALIFSAFLRQPASVSEEEKLAYVDHIIDLLELYDIRDALIGEAEIDIQEMLHRELYGLPHQNVVFAS